MAVKADMNGAFLRLFIVPGILSADGMLIGGEVVTFLPMDGAAGQAGFCRKAAKASAEAAFSLGERNALLMAPLAKVLLRYF